MSSSADDRSDRPSSASADVSPHSHEGHGDRDATEPRKTSVVALATAPARVKSRSPPEMDSTTMMHTIPLREILKYHPGRPALEHPATCFCSPAPQTASAPALSTCWSEAQEVARGIISVWSPGRPLEPLVLGVVTSKSLLERPARASALTALRVHCASALPKAMTSQAACCCTPAVHHIVACLVA